MGHTHGILWTDDKIKESILIVANALNIDRMPSNSEMSMVRNDSRLSNAIAKRGGFQRWSEIVSLKMKLSDTQTGKGYEELAIQEFKNFNYEVARMTTKYPYDLLINNFIRIDVKATRPHMIDGCRWHTVGINKKYATCDLYLIYILNELDGIEKTLIIPSHEVRLTSLNMGLHSKYDKYINRWDLVKKYDEFYKKLAYAY